MGNHLYDALLAPHLSNTKTLLFTKERGKITYQNLLRKAAQFAGVLQAAGVNPGDRVAVQIEKSPQAVALYMACIQTGGVFVPLNTAYTATEVDYFVNDAKPTVLVCDRSAEAALKPIAEQNNSRLFTLDADGSGTLTDLAKQTVEFNDVVQRNKDDLAAILYTSGTTGRSKGAMLTHNNLLSNAQVLVDYWKVVESDVLLHGLPIYHTHGLFVAINTIVLAGGSSIFLDQFDVDDFIHYLPQSTVMMGVPTFYTRLLSDDRLNKELVSHMRLFVSGSAPLLAETHEEFESRTGQRILERYGMTETNMTTSNPYQGERRAGTVGFALPGVEVRIVQPDTGNVCEKDEIGVLEVRGDNVFSGYWQMPEKTEQEFRSDGFFITGDLTKFDSDGYLHIVGRDKDLIISGGFNVYPKEIELLLDDQPDILESAVVGAPHPDFGESVIAVLVARPGHSINLDSIKAAAANSLAKFKQPKHYTIVEELPRNTMGKVQKNQLRESVKSTFT